MRIRSGKAFAGSTRDHLPYVTRRVFSNRFVLCLDFHECPLILFPVLSKIALEVASASGDGRKEPTMTAQIVAIEWKLGVAVFLFLLTRNSSQHPELRDDFQIYSQHIA